MSGGSGASGGSGGSSLVPVIGMYFLHPDHLGSITMITDGRGNIIAGGNNGGKSHISYKPYGEIHRTDSSGPDITRFKYTGQEEDKESGLLYYKARYYDPMIGRFAQADSMAFPDRIMGMNRYMYVEGNPLKYGDANGHKLTKPQGWALLGALAAPQYGISSEWGAAIGAGIGRREKIKSEKKGLNHRIEDYYSTQFFGGSFHTYKKDLSPSGQRKGLDSDEKMAAIGAMVNGQEGAIWGYMLGSVIDKKKLHDRRDNLIKNTADIVGVIGFFAGGPSWISFGFQVVSSAFGRLASSGPDGSIPGKYVCAYSFITHTIQKPNSEKAEGAREIIDLLCLGAAK